MCYSVLPQTTCKQLQLPTEYKDSAQPRKISFALISSSCYRKLLASPVLSNCMVCVTRHWGPPVLLSITQGKKSFTGIPTHWEQLCFKYSLTISLSLPWPPRRKPERIKRTFHLKTHSCKTCYWTISLLPHLLELYTETDFVSFWFLSPNIVLILIFCECSLLCQWQQFY